jgi:hypothetical protein
MVILNTASVKNVTKIWIEEVQMRYRHGKEDVVKDVERKRRGVFVGRKY